MIPGPDSEENYSAFFFYHAGKKISYLFLVIKFSWFCLFGSFCFVCLLFFQMGMHLMFD